MLKETAPYAVDQALLAEAARYLRLPEGFGEDHDAEIESALRAAIAKVEADIGLALLERGFIWRGALDACGAAEAPIGPVVSLNSVARVRFDGALAPEDVSGWRIDTHWTRSRIVAAGGSGLVEVGFNAGLAAQWSDVPPALARAVLILMAGLFDDRTGGAASAEIKSDVDVLISPWRRLRVGFGGDR